MSIERVKVYVHRSKESNDTIVDQLGVTGEVASMVRFLGYEEELVYDVDTKTGKSELVGAGGRFLSDESTTSETFGASE